MCVFFCISTSSLISCSLASAFLFSKNPSLCYSLAVFPKPQTAAAAAALGKTLKVRFLQPHSHLLNQTVTEGPSSFFSPSFQIISMKSNISISYLSTKILNHGVQWNVNLGTFAEQGIPGKSRRQLLICILKLHSVKASIFFLRELLSANLLSFILPSQFTSSLKSLVI